MKTRKKTDVGPQGKVQYMTAVSAGQNIGGNVNYVDNDNFYPADGMPNDIEFNDLTNRRSQIDKIDMVYDNDINDLGSNADFFDGDYQNSYAEGSYDEEDDEYDIDDNYDLDYDEYDDYNDYDDYSGIDDDDDYDEVEGNNYGLGVYDTDINDLGDDSDFFDGDGRPDYEDYDDEYDDYYDSDYDNVDGESFDYATGRRRKSKRPAKRRPQNSRRPQSGNRLTTSVGGFAKDRLSRRDARVDERRKSRDERRKAKTGAKVAEKTSRAELTQSLAQPDTSTAQILASLQDPTMGTKSATDTQKRRGLSTGAIIGIAAGSLALLGTVAYLILRKKK